MPGFPRRRAGILQSFSRIGSALLSLFKGSRRAKLVQPFTVRDPFERFLEEFRSRSAIAEQPESRKNTYLTDDN
jgi:hypothetical protein